MTGAVAAGGESAQGTTMFNEPAPVRPLLLPVAFTDTTYRPFSPASKRPAEDDEGTKPHLVALPGGASFRLVKEYEFLNRAGQTATSSSVETAVAFRSCGSKGAKGEAPTRVSLNVVTTGLMPQASALNAAVPLVGSERFPSLSTTMTVACQVLSAMSTLNVGCAAVTELRFAVLPGRLCNDQRYEYGVLPSV